MKRTSILLPTALALVLAACAGDQTEPTADATAEVTAQATATAEPTEEATPSATESEAPEPTEDGDGSGSIGDLADALPDEVGGLARNDVQGMESLIRPMLEAQGIDASDGQFTMASYGDGAEAVIVTAMSFPGINQAQLEMLARLISSSQAGAGTDVDAETVTVGGKQVIRVTPADAPQSVYIYLADDAFFSVISEQPDLAEELLSQLP